VFIGFFNLRCYWFGFSKCMWSWNHLYPPLSLSFILYPSSFYGSISVRGMAHQTRILLFWLLLFSPLSSHSLILLYLWGGDILVKSWKRRWVCVIRYCFTYLIYVVWWWCEKVRVWGNGTLTYYTSVPNEEVEIKVIDSHFHPPIFIHSSIGWNREWWI